MNLAIVDDEINEAKNFAEICMKWAIKEKIELNFSLFSNGEDFLDSFKNSQYSLIFLDIYMNSINRIEIAKRIKEINQKCLLVFLTSSEEHMSEALMLHMFDYIVKPASEPRVFKVLNDALTLLPYKNSYVDVQCGKNSTTIFLDDVNFAVTDGHYVNILKVDGNTLRLRLTLNQLLDILSDKRYLTINQGIAVNMDYIKSLTDNVCIMKDNTHLPVWNRKHLEVRSYYTDYLFKRMHKEQELAT